jgi:hypothetical protein
MRKQQSAGHATKRNDNGAASAWLKVAKTQTALSSMVASSQAQPFAHRNGLYHAAKATSVASLNLH